MFASVSSYSGLTRCCDDETDEGRLIQLTGEKSRAQTLTLPNSLLVAATILGTRHPPGRAATDFISSTGHQPCTCWASRRLFCPSTATLWASADAQCRWRCRLSCRSERFGGLDARHLPLLKTIWHFLVMTSQPICNTGLSTLRSAHLRYIHRSQASIIPM